jgi:uncharacterized membrane protein
MHLGKGLLLFAVFVACAAAFVWFTSLRLPNLVASHFGGSGIADGFMPHDFYVRFMLAFVIGLPALLVLLTWLAIATPKSRINLPNKDYWLAPERRAQTVAFLRDGILWFGVMLVVFLCYAHWLVVLANEAQPVRLAELWFLGGLVVFAAAMLIWLKILFGHFRRA